jgi:hypothetical protein
VLASETDAMPQTTIVFYKEADGEVPVLDWLRALRRRDRRACAACIARIQRLAVLGHELRRQKRTICAMAFMSCGYGEGGFSIGSSTASMANAWRYWRTR